MDYPNGFEIPIQPMARQLALARVMGIWICIAFLCIIALGGFMLWAHNSMRMQPFLIGIDNANGEWIAVLENAKQERTSDEIMQEFVAVNFAKNWLSISAQPDGRTIEESASKELYNRFSGEILPNYKSRAAAGEIWRLLEDSIAAHNEGEGFWHIRAVLESNKFGQKNIEAFVRLGKLPNGYPLTLGFFVADFLAYRE